MFFLAPCPAAGDYYRSELTEPEQKTTFLSLVCVYLSDWKHKA